MAAVLSKFFSASTFVHPYICSRLLTVTKTNERRDEPPSRSKVAWTVVRVILGLAQMVGASASLILLLLTGVNAWSIGGAVITSIITLTSILLFRSCREWWER